MEIVSDMVRKDPKFLLDVAWLRRQLIDLPEAEKLSEVCAVFNPGGVLTPEGKVILILRFETRRGNSGLVCCEIGDGEGRRVIPESLHFSLVDEGLEDPRVIWFDELKRYIITYVVAKEHGSNVAFMITDDFTKEFERKGEANFINEPNALIHDKPNKDACVLPVSIKIYGKRCFGLFHRPTIDEKRDIWFSYSSEPIQKRNLIDWEGHRCIAETKRGMFWDNSHIGLGTQPVELPEEISKNLPKGFPLFYHGARGKVYRTGAMWFSLEDLKITHRSPQWLFGPTAGSLSTIIFPCAAWYDPKTGEIVMYYGEDDECTKRCYWNARKLVSHLERHPV